MSTITIILLGLLPQIIAVILHTCVIIGFWFLELPCPNFFLTNAPINLFSTAIPIFIFYRHCERNHDIDRLLRGQFASIIDTLMVVLISIPFMILIITLHYYGREIVNRNEEIPAVVFIIVVVILGPIFEEVLLRGIVFKSLLERTSTTYAIIIVSTVAMLNHILTSVKFDYLLVMFVTDVLFSISYLKGKLGASILNHSIWNLTIFIAAKYGSTYLNQYL